MEGKGRERRGAEGKGKKREGKERMAPLTAIPGSASGFSTGE